MVKEVFAQVIRRVLSYKTKYVEREAATWNIPVVEYSELTRKTKDYFGKIYQAEIDGLIIRNAIKPSTIEINDLMSTKIDGLMLEETDFGRVVGRTLDGCAKDELEASYFSETPQIQKFLNNVFHIGFTDAIQKIIGQVSGGKKARLPAYGRSSYKPATVRCMQHGYVGMREHIGNEFLKYLPQEEHISSIIDSKIRFSYFLQVAKSEEGGNLALFDLVWKNTPQELVENQGVVHKMKERTSFLSGFKRMELHLNAGDLIIFDGGRIWHEVTPVEGLNPRITVGGFAAYSKNHDSIYFWS